MSQAAIATDIHQTLDIHLDALAKVAFDLSLRFQDRANPAQLVFTEISYARIEIDARFLEHGVRARAADAVNISQTDLGSLVGRKIYTCYTCHRISLLSLSLFVFGICADHSYYALAMDDLALVAHLLY